jgi:ABC-type transport system involved in multi-copper enzyme maturation permease subunit
VVEPLAVLARILTIALNTYREAVRARVLLGVFAVALATDLYSVLVGTLSLHNEPRVVADLGAASISLYGIVIAIVLGSTSLYRELEHKTIFPILSRPIRRWEYVVGKYKGAMLTVGVFVCVDTAAVLMLLALETGQPPWKVGATALVMLALLGVTLIRARHTRVFVLLPWSLALVGVAWILAAPSPEERQLVVAASVLAMSEIAIVAAVATLFASFSSPFLTATFTLMIFVIGRSSDTMAHIPVRQFGSAVSGGGKVLARIIPNLHIYVPARAFLLGSVAGQPVWPYVATAALHAVLYATVLLVLSALVFRKRDFA